MIANRIASGLRARGLNGSPSIDFSSASAVYGPLGGPLGGERITIDSATGLPAVYSAISLLSNVGGTLPLFPYEVTDPATRDSVIASDNGAFMLLHDQPNPDTDAPTFWTQVIADYAGWGNAFIGKSWKGRRLTALHNIQPDSMTVKRKDGKRIYIERAPGGKRREWSSSEIIHIRNIGRDGLVGLSPLAKVRDALGMALQMQRHATTFFRDLAVPPGALSIAEKLDPDVKDAIRAEWKKRHRDNGDIAVLDAGAKFETLSVPMADAQFAELTGLTRTDVALIYNIPPSMLAASTGDTNTYGNRESDGQNFLSVSLVGPLVRTEKALSNDPDIFPQTNKFYAEFKREAFLRSDLKTRAEVYRVALAGQPWMDQAEVRRAENLGPKDIAPVPPLAPPIETAP